MTVLVGVISLKLQVLQLQRTPCICRGMTTMRSVVRPRLSVCETLRHGSNMFNEGPGAFLRRILRPNSDKRMRTCTMHDYQTSSRWKLQ
jgi:hypothetical protein